MTIQTLPDDPNYAFCPSYDLGDVELTRFCGHLQTVRRRCSDAENSFTLRAGIPTPDG